jgi:integrase
MAQAKRDSLESRSSRLKKLPQKQPYWTKLVEGRIIGYYRPQSKSAGSWIAKFRDAETGARKQATLGFADDFTEADGDKILTWAQASEKAREWFDQASQEAVLLAGGEVLPKGPFKVADSMAAYFEDAERRGVKGLDRDRQRSALWILPELGALEVAKLTRRQIETWQKKLADAPKRKRTAKAGVKSHKKKASKDDPPPPKPAPPISDDEKRARKDTSNRVLSTLKAALNHALDRGRIRHGEAWQAVKPYKGTTSSRIMFLKDEDQVRLVNVCPPDFRRLVQGALYTGARYSELCRLRVKDFNASNGSIYIEFSKSGKHRHIVLTEEAQAFFSSITAGRLDIELMFLRDEVTRRKRPEVGGGWGASDQTRYMALACKAAEISKISFHELRHTYASGLVNAGLPMAYVAAQLGHLDTRMTEKHYGHLDETALAKAIRTLAPKLGLGEAANVAPLKIGGAS